MRDRQPLAAKFESGWAQVIYLAGVAPPSDNNIIYITTLMVTQIVVDPLPPKIHANTLLVGSCGGTLHRTSSQVGKPSLHRSVASIPKNA